MTTKIFAVKDAMAGAFLAPFTFAQEGMAVRAFLDTVNDASTPFHRHPDDFVLWILGEFDEDTGELSNGDKRAIVSARSLLNGQQEIGHAEG